MTIIRSSMPVDTKKANESDTISTKEAEFDPYPAPPEHAMSHIEEVRSNEQLDALERKEREHLEYDTIFNNYEGFVIIDGYDSIEEMLNEEKEQIEEYNKLLSSHQIPYSIRNKHIVKVGNTTYLYNGMYIYKKEVIRSPPLYIPNDEMQEFQCPLCKVIVIPANRTRHMNTKTHKKKFADYTKSEQKLLYVGKFSHAEWRNLLGEEKFREVSSPPKPKISSLRFRHVYRNEEPTSSIVVPADVVIQEEFRKLITDHPVMKLG